MIHKMLWVILILYFVLAGFYAHVTPLFEKPDENWHFATAMYIMETGRLPQNKPDAPLHYARQQANQPPLYYLTLSPVLRVLGYHHLTSGYLHLAEPNVQYRTSPSPFQSDNRRLFVPGRCEGDCARVESAVYIGRYLSILYVGLSLIFTAYTLKAIFPQNDALILLTVAIMGFNPQVLHIGSSVTNDSLMILLMSVGFYLAARWLNGTQNRRMVMLMGLVAGAAVLTKLSAAVLGLALGLLLLIYSTQRVRDIVLYGVSAIAVCGWWLVYNIINYGDPTALDAHIDVAPQADVPQTFSAILSQLPTVIRSFWAEFGWGQVILPEQLYIPVVILILGSLFVGCVYIFVKWRVFSHQQRIFMLMMVGVSMVSVVLLLRWMMMTQAPHGRLLFAAVMPISLLMAAGLSMVIPRRGIGAACVGLFVFAMIIPWDVIRPAYLPPPPRTAFQLGTVNVQFYELGYGEVTLRDAALIEDTDWYYVQLTWEVEAEFQDDYLVFIHLLNANGDIIAQRDSYPGLGNTSFSRMDAGEIFNDVYPLNPPVEPISALRMGVYRVSDIPDTWLRLDAESDVFNVQDDAVTIPIEMIRVE